MLITIRNFTNSNDYRSEFNLALIPGAFANASYPCERVRQPFNYTDNAELKHKTMKNILIIFLSFTLLSCNEKTKSKDTSNYSQTIKDQAEKMGQLLLKKDFKSFVKFTYPKIVEIAGGQDMMIQTIEKSLMEMETNGASFLSFTFGDPSKIIKEGNELQGTMPETIEMKVSNGRVVIKSTLIVVSTDQGKNWFFIDTSDKEIQTMKKALPNLSGDLKIPAKQQPTLYND